MSTFLWTRQLARLIPADEVAALLDEVEQARTRMCEMARGHRAAGNAEVADQFDLFATKLTLILGAIMSRLDARVNQMPVVAAESPAPAEAPKPKKGGAR